MMYSGTGSAVQVPFYLLSQAWSRVEMSMVRYCRYVPVLSDPIPYYGTVYSWYR